jgi:hypothetical protein
MSDRPPKFTPDEAPTLEIGPEADLMSLSHDEQVEIALASLDELPLVTTGECIDLAKQVGGEINIGLADIAPDPDFLIVAPEENPAVEDRPTIIPEIPITMDDLEPLPDDENSRPTRPYPPEFKYIGEFMTSTEMLEYEIALRQHRLAVSMHLSGVNRTSTLPEPPHFHDYFQRFLKNRAAKNQQAEQVPDRCTGREMGKSERLLDSPPRLPIRPASQSGRYSLLLHTASDEDASGQLDDLSKTPKE